MNSPSMAELYNQADGDWDRYRALLIKHGHLIPSRNVGKTQALHQFEKCMAEIEAQRPMVRPLGWHPHAKPPPEDHRRQQ